MAVKVAIVHDYLNQRGGAERVVGVLHELFPEAPIYTLFVDRDKLWPSLKNAHVVPSVLQHFPFIRRHFKLFFWLYPLVMSTMRLHGDYDVVLSSSSAYAKGIRLSRRHRPAHICYCHTPMRFAWNFDEYIQHETRQRWLQSLARLLVPWLKAWDVRTVRNVDVFLANSTAVQRRIKDIYGRDSTLVFPPVEEKNPENSDCKSKDYFLVTSRLVSYKRIDLAVKVCSIAGWNLVVIGDGPDRSRLESMAGPTISFLGWQPEDVVTSYMAGCDAFVFPGEEDFGITPVEVNLLGRPVVAYQAGGALDTVTEGVNGIFFSAQTVDDLLHALQRARSSEWDSNRIRQAAQRFEKEFFIQSIHQVVDRVYIEKEQRSALEPVVAGSGGFTDIVG